MAYDNLARISIYTLIFRVVEKQALIAGAMMTWVSTENPEDLDIRLSIGLSRGGETFEIDFERVVAMLEKHGTFDLDFSEVEQYINVTCALLPPPTHDWQNTLVQAAVAQKMAAMQSALAQNQALSSGQYQMSLQSTSGNIANALGGGLGLGSFFGKSTP